ncbi:MAG: hypothetical protein WAM46_12060 [Flavobacterium sp.]
MTLFKDKFKIDSKRLKNRDYSDEGVYFITMVENNFGQNSDKNIGYNFNQNCVQNQNKSESSLSRKSNSISSFIALFKSVTTRQINGSVSIWQSNYHDDIVRNYKRFETIYNYIKTNPSSWETDSMKL